MKRAFSLIEVLIATTILGLGVLALIAVLAAGASEQQASGRQNLAVGAGRNADALLAHAFGRMVARSGSPLEDGRWYPVFQDQQTYFLSVSPFFFLVDGPTDTTALTLYQNPFPTGDPNAGWGMLSYNSAAPAAPFRGQQPGDLVKRLPNRRVHPLGFSVTVELANRNNPQQTALSITFPHTVTFPNDRPDVSYQSPVTLRSAGLDSSTLLFDYREGSLSEGDTARIVSFTLSGFPGSAQSGNFRVLRIRVSPYQWRNDDLVSLNDRLIYEPDPTFPTGRRPVMGYTTLYRVLGSTSQLCFLTYALQPLSRPDPRLVVEGFPFIPPENAQDFFSDTGLLRRVDLELGYDPATEEFFFEIPLNDEPLKGWALAPGQLITIERANPTLPNPEGLGSDFPVRVVAQRRVGPAGAGALRAVLDRSPRMGGRTPLDDLTSASSTIFVQALALQPAVQSLSGDRSDWRIRPVESRVIQVEDE